MRAMVVRAPGGTDVLKMETIADPTPGPKDVVIKIDACGVCFHDIVTRNGTLKFGVQMPLILGHEISGTVVDVGRDVRGFKTGDKVATVQRYHICGSCRHGEGDAVPRPQVHRRCRHGRRLRGIRRGGRRQCRAGA